MQINHGCVNLVWQLVEGRADSCIRHSRADGTLGSLCLVLNKIATVQRILGAIACDAPFTASIRSLAFRDIPREPVIFANPALPSSPTPFAHDWAKGTVKVSRPPLGERFRERAKK